MTLLATRSSGAIRPCVHWHEGGSTDAPTLLLLNGWTASGLVWPRAWVSELEQKFRVIRVDNRGSGWSRSAPTPYTIGQLADDAAAVLKYRHRVPAVVLGLSMGGMIAQELAARHNDLVQRLVLVGTRPPAPDHLAMNPEELRAALRQRRSGESWSEFITSLWARQAAPGFAEKNRPVMAEIVQSVLRRSTPSSGVLGQARAIGAWTNSGLHQRIIADTVVVHGSLDPMMPVGNGARLAAGIEGADYIELSEVGHLVPFEAPEVLGQILIDHL